ncbi:MAG: response regulator [Desulfobacterales bacterium]|nr:response regulator [Desulfobacterales bacterium]
MHTDVVILVAEDDEGHANLIKRNLKRAGILNRILLFRDGQEILDFLFKNGKTPHREAGAAYVLLLDIRMPKVDGVQVLERVKADPELCKLPVIMITTTDDPREIEHCHVMGCSNYITKPIDYESFVNAVRQLGMFLSVVQVPVLKDET